MKIEQIDYSVNVLKTILWQYENAENISQLIKNKQNWMTQQHTQFWEYWYTTVFDLTTANDFGLSVWSIILNVPYLVQETSFGPVWGFNQIPLININQNFLNGNFGHQAGRVVLTTEEQRLFLRLRYYQLVSRGGRLQTNQMLDSLFNDPNGLYQGGAWVIDNLDMTITYVFNCPISIALLNVLKFYDVLPRPAGELIRDYIMLY
jgi:hypothetical protein